MSLIRGAQGVPSLFRKKAFHAADIAEAVNYFVALGEREAARHLIRFTPSPFSEPVKVRLARDFELLHRVGWVMRILFLSKTEQPLREPHFWGGVGLPILTMPLARWPLYPVAASGDSFFVLSERSMIGGGMGEDPRKYLKYCQTEGLFRMQPVAVPTREQALKDVMALRQSDAWKAIKWKDSAPGRSYTMHEGTVWDYLNAQAYSIPTP